MTSMDIGVDNEGNLTTAEAKDEAFPILNLPLKTMPHFRMD